MPGGRGNIKAERPEYTLYHAWLERSDKGLITHIIMSNGHEYGFEYDENDIVVDISSVVYQARGQGR